MERDRARLSALPMREAIDRDFLIQASHLFGLTALAIGQPMYDLLGRNPTFFIAHNATPGTIWLFTLALSLLLPLALISIEVVATILNRSAGRLLHVFFVAGTVSIIAIQLLEFLTCGFAYSLIVAAAALGIWCARAYWLNPKIRSYFSFLNIAALAAPALFLFLSPATPLLFPPKLEGPAVQGDTRGAPIVFLIFDELSALTLLREDGSINETWFPRITELSKSSTWFPKALAADHATHRAIPMMLSGTRPALHKGIATRSHYPNNLFVWLAPYYKFNAVEPVTALCPAEVCAADPFDPSFFLADLKIVLEHVVLPDELAARYLPDIGSNWAGFASQNEEAASKLQTGFGKLVGSKTRQGRPDRFRDFIAGIEPGNTLNFYHVLLPHTPWHYMPSGRQYTKQRLKGTAQGVWDPEPSILRQNYHRYLLQVGLVDNLVGQLTDHLKAQGMYDDAMIILAADHGISFVPKGHKRRPYEGNPAETLRIPLFIKRPGQTSQVVDKRVVIGRDIVPTISDLLGLPLDWETKGASLFNPDSPKRKKVRIQKITYSARRIFSKSLARWQHDSFDPDVPLDAVVIKGPFHEQLAGKAVDELEIEDRGGELLMSSELFDQATPTARKSRFPFLIEGEVETDPPLDQPAYLAFAVNGKIVLTTSTFAWKDRSHYFTALFPEAAASGPDHTIEGYRIDNTGGRIRLRKLTVAKPAP